MKFPIIAVVSLIPLPFASAWGDLGHYTVALLAQKYLDTNGTRLIKQLLATEPGKDLADIALWADEVIRAPRPIGRSNTSHWHYINANNGDPPTHCTLEYSRDCDQPGRPPGCIVSAITTMTSVMLGTDTSEKWTDALKFLIHFLGDIHQPLHTEFLLRGGNDIKPMCFYTRCAKDMDLHEIWDSMIPRKLNGLLGRSTSPAEEKVAAELWAERLFTRHGKGGMGMGAGVGVGAAEECTDVTKARECAVQWAREINGFECSGKVFTGASRSMINSTVGDEYYNKAVPVVEEVIGKAGMRLGRWINGLAAHGRVLGMEQQGGFEGREELK